MVPVEEQTREGVDLKISLMEECEDVQMGCEECLLKEVKKSEWKDVVMEVDSLGTLIVEEWDI